VGGLKTVPEKAFENDHGDERYGTGRRIDSVHGIEKDGRYR
jgi:hypothetical protein